MAVYYLKNSLNPDEVVAPVTVDLALIQETPKVDGEDTWVVDFTTKVRDTNGDVIPTHTIRFRQSKIDIEDVIEEGLAWIGQRIDWGTLHDDTAAPYVESYSPTATTDVSIFSPVFFFIKDPMPSVGVDPSSITLTVNDIDVTNQLEVQDLATITKVKWEPVRIV